MIMCRLVRRGGSKPISELSTTNRQSGSELQTTGVITWTAGSVGLAAAMHKRQQCQARPFQLSSATPTNNNNLHIPKLCCI